MNYKRLGLKIVEACEEEGMKACDVACYLIALGETLNEGILKKVTEIINTKGRAK